MQFKDLLKRRTDVERDAAVPDDRPAPGKAVGIAEKVRADRDIVSAQVAELGYKPLAVEDGARAVEFAREYLPRLVVANAELGDKSGPELVAALRENKATRDIPIMLISNSQETPDMTAGGQVGANEYVCKPLDAAMVKARIRALLLKDSQEVPHPQPARPAGRAVPAGPAEPASPPSSAGGGGIEQAEALYAECCKFAGDAAERAGRMEPPDIARCRELAGGLVQGCERGNRLLLKAIRPYRPDETGRDATNVAIFSIKIGRGLRYDAEELTALAMAALCHEVGMSCVPSELASAEGRYTRQQWDQIRRHPEHAHDILGKLGEKYDWLAEAVYQEHEREQGQGYPRGLRGDQISDFARIIGLADTYESLSHRRTFRKAFIAFDALREIIGMRGKYFAPHIIRALVSEVSVFPLESYVLLNTGETARVVKTNPDNLLRPTVVVEYDASGQKMKKPKLVDLVSKPLLYVTKPVDERDLAREE